MPRSKIRTQELMKNKAREISNTNSRNHPRFSETIQGRTRTLLFHCQPISCSPRAFLHFSFRSITTWGEKRKQRLFPAACPVPRFENSPPPPLTPAIKNKYYIEIKTMELESILLENGAQVSGGGPLMFAERCDR
ncbi:hypothetical protein AVEN_215998-1 [Araneus ventricosus]|uniref:Uncharacterized protein n=1 Tax=Araneus ventricosus TaxID=182803 RepID=A0A4Y2W9Q7_ARAVE|nr:hypothetical protein AVEN_121467-1 [Araneus ventricosus]GBO33192.1 hypothetical protein AVEN_260970-1 [Araneus ventricosus]GBO33206.1 hypothetical protein AVEN_215615-1 [Araneus ventricosus]GBO33209.1 hypothetical protein AVEN_215998-1 [Araneus ventricosus]